MDYLVSFLRKPSIGNAPARINGPVKIIVQLNFKFDDEVLGKPAVGKCLIFNMLNRTQTSSPKPKKSLLKI